MGSLTDIIDSSRQLGKKPVMTIDNIEKVTWEVEKKVANTQSNRAVRRLRAFRLICHS